MKLRLLVLAAVSGWVVVIAIILCLTIQSCGRDPKLDSLVEPSRVEGREWPDYSLYLNNGSGQHITNVVLEYEGWRYAVGPLADGEIKKIPHGMTAGRPIVFDISYEDGSKQTYDWIAIGSYDGPRLLITDEGITTGR